MSRYLLLDGTEGNYVSTDDVADLDLPGDFEIIDKSALDDWTPDEDRPIVSKWSGSNGYLFQVEESVGGKGSLRLVYNDGSIRSASSTVNPTVADGEFLWRRVTGVVNGANRDITFYTSADITDDPDAVSWVQLGDVVVIASSAAIAGNAIDLFGGAQSASVQTVTGKLAHIRLVNDSVTVAEFDADDFNVGDGDTDTAVDSTGKTWTIHGPNAVIQSDQPELIAEPASETATATDAVLQPEPHLTAQLASDVEQAFDAVLASEPPFSGQIVTGKYERQQVSGSYSRQVVEVQYP